MTQMQEMWHKCYFDVLKERDAKKCLISKVGNVTWLIGYLKQEMSFFCQLKKVNLSRIIELSKNNGEAIRSAKVVLNKTTKWWPLSKI